MGYRKTVVLTTAAALTVAISGGALAQDFGDQLKSGLVDDAALTLHLRSYYLDRHNPGATPNNTAWAGGGWIGYQTGWFYDAVRLGAVGYTSQPLWAPSDRDGTLLLRPGQDGYTVLGQAYGKVKLWGQEFTGYRQLIDLPEVNSQDNRMTPNTFEAYALTGKFGNFSYFGGFVDQIKPRNSIDFIDMAKQAGAPAGTDSEGMWLVGLTFTPEPTLKARVSAYYVPNILTSGYVDVSKTMPLTNEMNLRLGGQFMVQGSNGDNSLTGDSFDSWAGGVDLGLIWGPVTFTTMFTQTGSDAAYRTPYGSWAGYTSMIVKDFNRAEERAFLVGATLDMAVIDAPGLAFTTNLAFGSGATDANTGASLNDNNEYDFTLDYRFVKSRLDWPDWLRPLWLRGRAAIIDQDQAGWQRDYRVILNYEWVFDNKS